MIEPGEIKNLLLAFFAAAMIIGSGTLYAVCVGLAGRAVAKRGLERAAVAAFAALCGFVALFFYAANLRGFWLLLAALMLAGYWAMPRAILRLTVATHGDSPPPR